MESPLSFLSAPVSSMVVCPFSQCRAPIHQSCECPHVWSSVTGFLASWTSLLLLLKIEQEIRKKRSILAKSQEVHHPLHPSFTPPRSPPAPSPQSLLSNVHILHPSFPPSSSSFSSPFPPASSPDGAIKGNHCPKDVLCASGGHHQSWPDTLVQTWTHTGRAERIIIDWLQRQNTLPVKSIRKTTVYFRISG